MATKKKETNIEEVSTVEVNTNDKPTKKKTTQKTTVKNVDKVEEVKPQVDMQQMFAMFQQFMNMQQQVQQVETKEVKADIKPKKITKSNIRKERGDEDVLVRSVVGIVSFTSPKTGITYNWTSVGDEEWLSVEEVLQMETTSKKFLHAPWLEIEDEQLIEVLGIEKITKIVEELRDIDDVLENYNIEYIEDLLGKSTKEYRDNFASIILEKVKNEELRDTVLIRELGRILKVNFELYK